MDTAVQVRTVVEEWAYEDGQTAQFVVFYFPTTAEEPLFSLTLEAFDRLVEFVRDAV